jgi:O-antigen/teichoic acid export membrane protein
LLNLIGQAVFFIVGVVAIPFIIRGLGTERFGLLSIAWVILGFFTIFDLGLGRATTKYVAEAIGKGEKNRIPRLAWTAVTMQGILGLVGALILVGLTPYLVEHILNISPMLIGEARSVFYILALSVPVVLVTSSFSGVLEAAQRFDLVNAVRIPSSASTYLLTLLGLSLGFQLPGIVMLNLVLRFITLVAMGVFAFHIFPELKKFSVYFTFLPSLLSYGGWMMVTSVANPILVYLDRFLIGSLLSMAAVAYYAAPHGAVTRLWIIPMSLIMTLFPAFSTLEGVKDEQRLGTFFARSVKYVLLSLGPIVLGIGFFAREILQIWLGIDFAVKSTAVLQVLVFGVFINSLAQIPCAFLQGIGRPDLPAKFHLLELPFYIGIVLFSISKWGILGAAWAWTLRVSLDALLLFGATFKIYRFSPGLFAANGTTLAFFAFMMFAGILYILKFFLGNFSLFVQSPVIIGFFSLFVWFAWKSVLDASDREAVLKVVKLWKNLEA